ncbi:MAG TPA: GNAT family N-acetyltransferase [Thermoanaerobaculia bacterium]
MIREATRAELDQLTPLLLLAEPSLRALRWSFRHMSDAVYRLDVDGTLAGAATMRWRGEPCELVELAIAPERQGQGLGKQFVAWLIEEAKRRGKRQMIVGTSSTSAANLLFYQKAGFRIDSIRHDYFWYYDEPVIENGLPVRDMIVFRYEL